MDSITLKQCPFCGSTGTLDAQQSYFYMGYKVAVRCQGCGAKGGQAISKTDPAAENWQTNACKEAADKWNQRKATRCKQ